MSVRVQIDARRVARILELKERGAAQAAARKAQRRVRENMAALDRVRSGEMMRSVQIRKVSNGVYDIYSDLYYTKYQEHGVGPFGPVRAKVLRFIPKGQNHYVFAHRVRGFEGGRFFRKAMGDISLTDFVR